MAKAYFENITFIEEVYIVGDVVNVSEKIKWRKFGKLTEATIVRYFHEPVCKTITDFFAYHHLVYVDVRSLTLLSLEQRSALLERMNGLFDLLVESAAKLLLEFGVEEETLLSKEQRRLYYARLRAIKSRHDYYSYPGVCNEVRDFFASRGLCYHGPASYLRLSSKDRAFLAQDLAVQYELIQQGKERLLFSRGVTTEDALSREEREKYHDEVRIVIRCLDHYRNKTP